MVSISETSYPLRASSLIRLSSDFISYPFGIYRYALLHLRLSHVLLLTSLKFSSSSILEVVYGNTTDLRVIFGWNVGTLPCFVRQLSLEDKTDLMLFLKISDQSLLVRRKISSAICTYPVAGY